MKSYKDDAENREKMRDTWKSKFKSVWNKMSRGAQEISRMITSAHGDQWRHHDNQHNKNSGPKMHGSHNNDHRSASNHHNKSAKK